MRKAKATRCLNEKIVKFKDVYVDIENPLTVHRSCLNIEKVYISEHVNSIVIGIMQTIFQEIMNSTQFRQLIFFL